MALFAPMQNIDALHFYVHRANIKLYHSLQNNRSIEGLNSISKDREEQSNNSRFGSSK